MASNQPPEKKSADHVRLEHKHNYVGGNFAYKNSSKKGRRLDPGNLTELVLMTKPGRASRVSIALPEEDMRAGTFPQHNTNFKNTDEEEIISTQDYIKTLELIPSRTLEPYAHLTDLTNLAKAGFEKRICSMTKSRLEKIKEQFSHLSDFAFNQMLDIPRPDKRDFKVWYKIIKKANQVIIAYPNEKTHQTNFVQVIQYDDQTRVTGIKHCTFDNGEPLVINETLVDEYGNLRQIAHLGKKSELEIYNSVERFDDGTVAWVITQNKLNGSAILTKEAEIYFVQNERNDSSELAARNLGAESVEDGEWTGKFSEKACKEESSPMQEAFKDKVRKQINQIIDGASIPGLDPIFWI
jgi:hypothetical protein